MRARFRDAMVGGIALIVKNLRSLHLVQRSSVAFLTSPNALFERATDFISPSPVERNTPVPGNARLSRRIAPGLPVSRTTGALAVGFALDTSSRRRFDAVWCGR